MTRTIIKSDILIDGTGGRALEAAAVVVDDGRIAWFGRSADLAEEVAGAITIEAPGKALMPGLIDAHVHLVCWGAGSSPREYLCATDEHLLLMATANAQAGIRAGVTTMRDVGSRDFLVLALRDAINSGTLTGPRILASGPAITTTGGHFYYFGREADTAEEAVKAVRELCKAGVDLIKVMGTGGNSTPGSNPRRAQYTMEQLRAIIEDAHRLGRPVTIHVLGTPGIRNAIAAGVDCLEHCTWLGESGTEYDEVVAQQIVDKGIPLSLGLMATNRLASDAKVAQMTAEQHRAHLLRQSRFEVTRRMIALGMKVVVSSDAGMLMTRTDDIALLLQDAVSSLGMTPVEAIRSATSLAAEAIGIGNEVGTIARGKRADLMLVEGDPRENIAALMRVNRVLRDGKTVVLNGMLR